MWCNCKNIEIWSYDRQTSMKMPTWKKNGWVCVDTCIVQEVAELWQLWITTTWCCCGHNKNIWFIWVVKDDISKMKKLWYMVQPNKLDLTREDSFYLKTIK